MLLDVVHLALSPGLPLLFAPVGECGPEKPRAALPKLSEAGGAADTPVTLSLRGLSSCRDQPCLTPCAFLGPSPAAPTNLPLLRALGAAWGVAQNKFPPSWEETPYRSQKFWVLCKDVCKSRRWLRKPLASLTAQQSSPRPGAGSLNCNLQGDSTPLLASPDSKQSRAPSRLGCASKLPAYTSRRLTAHAPQSRVPSLPLS